MSREPTTDFIYPLEREEYYCTLFSYGYYPHKSSRLPLNRGLLGLMNCLKTFLPNFNLSSAMYAVKHLARVEIRSVQDAAVLPQHPLSASEGSVEVTQ